MRALILSDIHANFQALEAVLAAAAGQFDELWNLGDMVGYGGSPNQVIERVRPLSTTVVRGNHDRVSAGLTSANSFNPVARAAVLWTRAELTAEHTAWLRAVPQGPLTPDGHPDIACAHGSPLDEDLYILNLRDAWGPLRQMRTPITFIGHTHMQGGFSQHGSEWREFRPSYGKSSGIAASAATVKLGPGTRHLINPGSVGQPRDGDWRAAYALFDPDRCELTFHRVPYDLVAAQGRILMAGLPERLAERLREGR